ncbi:DUF6179 domain-containing protein [Vagococcus carniphilus]|uniref:Uncharacterized protein n=1 Tax=Vagococcus carniphilus TaxID=218144 RepID=A0A430B6C0_9ENTE|nr:DUF6179 domain-containing protein [Vagococcus carniphilus]QNN72761.1 hypothetical protein H9L18_13005 [Vagococcus carniphilus]RSU15865.1 hypothetical protein CBF28_05370 [Vagococcus carniphilus]
MNLLTQNNNEEFQTFLLCHIRSKLSGTSIMSMDEVLLISDSIQYVLNHSVVNGTIEEQFLSGKQQIEMQISFLKKEVSIIQELNVFEQSLSYQDTFKELTTFFKFYDVDYQAKETGEAWIDYQLAHPINDQLFEGIDYMSHYIKCLKKEALFVYQLPPTIVNDILREYEEKLSFDYRIDINNLYEVIFNQVVTKFLVTSKLSEMVSLSQIELDYLMSQKEFVLPEEMSLFINSDAYYEKSYKKLIAMLHQKKTHTLLIKEKQKTISEIKLVEPMLENDYKSLIVCLEKLSNREIVEEISCHVKSPYDFEEILETLYFNEEDWSYLFSKMPLELIFSYLCLIKQQSGEELTSLEDFLLMEQEKDYLVALKRHLSELDKKTKMLIEEGLKQVVIEKLDFY